MVIPFHTFYTNGTILPYLLHQSNNPSIPFTPIVIPFHTITTMKQPVHTFYTSPYLSHLWNNTSIPFTLMDQTFHTFYTNWPNPPYLLQYTNHRYRFYIVYEYRLQKKKQQAKTTIPNTHTRQNNKIKQSFLFYESGGHTHPQNSQPYLLNTQCMHARLKSFMPKFRNVPLIWRNRRSL